MLKKAELKSTTVIHLTVGGTCDNRSLDHVPLENKESQFYLSTLGLGQIDILAHLVF